VNYDSIFIAITHHIEALANFALIEGDAKKSEKSGLKPQFSRMIMNAKTKPNPNPKPPWQTAGYNFGDGSAEGKAGMKNLLGGKGANCGNVFARASRLRAFTIRRVCVSITPAVAMPSPLSAQIEDALAD